MFPMIRFLITSSKILNMPPRPQSQVTKYVVGGYSFMWMMGIVVEVVLISGRFWMLPIDKRRRWDMP